MDIEKYVGGARLKDKPDKKYTLVLNDNVVSNTKLQDGSVTTEKLQDGAVSSDKIVSNAVTEEKIKKNSITADNLADGAVTTTKIADNAVTTPKIGNSQVTTEKINNYSVTSEKIADETITEEKLAPNAITTYKIADKSITEAKMQDSVITADKIAKNAVTAEKLVDYSVTEDKLADGAITTAKLADGLITELQTITDAVPTAGSIKPVQSGGVAQALDEISEAAGNAKRIRVLDFTFSDLVMLSAETKAKLTVLRTTYQDGDILMMPQNSSLDSTLIPASCIGVDINHDWNMSVSMGEVTVNVAWEAYSNEYQATIKSLDGKQDVIQDLAVIREGAAEGATAYQLPADGIPATDMENSVQSALTRAASAVTSADVTAIIKMTQAAYDQITPDPNTLYIIVS